MDFDLIVSQVTQKGDVMPGTTLRSLKVTGSQQQVCDNPSANVIDVDEPAYCDNNSQVQTALNNVLGRLHANANRIS